MGIQAPRVRWGIHPELLAYTKERPAAGGARDRFFYPAGFLFKRKPLPRLLKAFQRAEGDDRELLIKGQVERELEAARDARRRDPRVGGARGPADRRAHGAVRVGRRLPGSEPLGGARPASVRGDGAWPAGDHQRRAADERGDRRPRQRAAGALAAARPGELRDPRPAPGDPRPHPGRCEASRARTCSPSSARGVAAARERLELASGPSRTWPAWSSWLDDPLEASTRGGVGSHVATCRSTAARR